jgi:hypothetical protein
VLSHGRDCANCSIIIAQSDARNAVGEGAVVVLFATFPVGAIIPVIAKELGVPAVFLATPEQPKADKMWTQNSFCGANMAVHTFRKLGKKYAFAFGPADQAAALAAKPLAVLKCVSDLASAKVGLVGGRVPGFYTSNCDEMRLRSNHPRRHRERTGRTLPLAQRHEQQAALARGRRARAPVDGRSRPPQNQRPRRA